MRLRRTTWIPLVLFMSLGCQQVDRAPEERAGKSGSVQRAGVVPEASPAPRAADHAVPPDAEPVGPFAARGPAPTLRIGRRAQPDGRILDSDQTDVFMGYDPIRFSAVASGAMAQLVIQDQRTKEEVWRSQQAVAAGVSFVNFELGPGKLAPGAYVGVLTFDGRSVTQHAFKVSSH